MIRERKVACVTGACGGIGQEICLCLAQKNFLVISVDLVEEEKGKNLIQGLKGKGHIYLEADIGSSEGRKKIEGFVREKIKRLDLLVNNAGVAPLQRTDILETTEESYDRVMNINLKGTFFLTQSLARYLISLVESGVVQQPRIINISSISAYASSVNRAEYCLSKAGVSMLTRLFAHRLARYGIYVYEIRPGIIATPMTASVKEKYNRLIFQEDLLPVSRWGKPQDVAAAVLAIAEGYFDYSTGMVFDVDGGFHLRRL